MKTNKILFLVQDKHIIKELEKLSVNLVYPLKFFSVGFNTYFNIDEIPSESYIYINKALFNDDYDKLKVLFEKYSFKGIVFEDLGILELLNDNKMEKILYQPHQLTNFMSVNYMLEFVDSIILSTDITKEEIDEIINKTNKEICIFGFGYVSAMYSKRKLLSNYALNYNLKVEDTETISVDNKSFIINESQDGTVLYDTPCTNNISYINEKKVKYVFINSVFLDSQELIKLIKGSNCNIKYYDGFLNKKTIFKLNEGE